MLRVIYHSSFQLEVLEQIGISLPPGSKDPRLIIFKKFITTKLHDQDTSTSQMVTVAIA